MSTSRAAVRARVYRLPEFGETILGFASTATGTGTTGIPDTVKFGPTQIGEYQYADGWGYVPSLTGAQRVKRMGALSSTTLLHADNANWSSVINTTPYEWLVPGVHPDDFNRCIQEAMRELYVSNHLPETPWPDGNFEGSATTDFAGTSATLSKVSDAIYGRVGSKSLLVTNTGANGNAAGAAGIKVQPGQRWQFDALARCVQGGPIQWRIYDITTSIVELGTPAIAYGYTPVLLQTFLTIPAGVYAINCVMQNDDATGITAWDALPGRMLGARSFPLDTWAKAHFNITGLNEATGYTSLTEGTRAYDATARDFKAWQRGRDFDTEHLAGNSTPSTVRLFRDPRLIPNDTELWYSSQRKWADVDDLDTEAATSEVDEDLLVYATAAKVCDLLNKDGSDPYFRQVKAIYEAKVAAQTAARPPITLPARRQRVGGRLGP